MEKYKKLFWLIIYIVLLICSVSLLYYATSINIVNFLCGILFGFSICKIINLFMKKDKKDDKLSFTK
jgi:hypothetical protein